MVEGRIFSDEPVLAGLPREKIFDVRTVPCAHKHRQIFQRWAGLPVGDWFVLVNDHRPEPLRAQFAHLVPGCFSWTELSATEGLAAVRIGRLRADPAGFDANAARGCGVESTSPDDGVLARIEIDVREDAPEVAGARVLRLAGTMPPWAELVAVLAERSPLLLRRLDLVGMSATEEAATDGWTYRVRVAGSETAAREPVVATRARAGSSGKSVASVRGPARRDDSSGSGGAPAAVS